MMLYKGLPGFIEVICGSMFSGKTEELVRRIKRAQYGRLKVQVFKPAIDNRYSEDHVQSHDANRILSTPVRDAREILEKVEDNTRVVGIDEIQFFDESIVEVANKLAYRGIRVICAGLDMDFQGAPFGPIPKLLAIAESVTKLQAVCVVCGLPATRSQRLIGGVGVVAVGAAEMYEPRCRFCHEPNSIKAQPAKGLTTHPKSTGKNSDHEAPPSSAEFHS
jgi:thymidine kinase